MSHSKNDFECMSGTARFLICPAQGKQDAVYMLINPQTTCPYTNKELQSALEQRKTEHPVLAQMIEAELSGIDQKAYEHANAVYQLRCRGNTEEEAAKRAKRELLPRLERIAKLLFRPQWESNIERGSVTVEQYAHYMGNTLYSGVSKNTHTHLISALKTVILPVIGAMRLCELDNRTQEKVIRKINSRLRQKKASASFRGYAKRAYKGLFEAIKSSGYANCSGGIRLADMIIQANRKNFALLNSIRTAHLDDQQREALFALLSDEKLLYPLFIVALIYSGMDACEISALCFGAFEQLELEKESCYTITVTKMMRKVNKRYSSISAVNDDFPIRRLRKVVLYPWAADILLRYIEHLRRQGYCDAQIAQMRLSDKAPGSAIFGPREIEETIEPLLSKAGVEEIQIPRTRQDGSVYLKIESATIETLYRDAQYIAECCGANRPMMHAMFGISRTETDEEAYLDVLSDEYAVARYLRLKRFSPFKRHYPQRYILKVENNTTKPEIFRIASDCGIKSYWKEIGYDETD